MRVLLLEEEGLVRDSELVHVVQLLPCLTLNIEQLHLAISVGVFASDEYDFAG